MSCLEGGWTHKRQVESFVCRYGLCTSDMTGELCKARDGTELYRRKEIKYSTMEKIEQDGLKY